MGITIWAIWTFQTKVEARATEKRVDEEIVDIHNHLNKTRNEIREDIKTIWTDFATTKQELGAMAKDVSYIRGLLEPGRRP